MISLLAVVLVVALLSRYVKKNMYGVCDVSYKIQKLIFEQRKEHDE